MPDIINPDVKIQLPTSEAGQSSKKRPGQPTSVFTSADLPQTTDPHGALEKIANGNPQERNTFQKMSENVDSLVKQIEKNEGDVVEAKKLLGSLLKARERFYLSVAQAINPDIEEVAGKENVYRVGGKEIYGSIVAVLDATPSLSSHAALAEKLRVQLPEESQVVVGEELHPRKLVQSAIVFSGSSAQDRIQPFGADIDMAEHIRINAKTKEEAAQLLTKSIQESVNQSVIVVDEKGRQITLHFSEMKAGGSYPSDAAVEIRGQKMRWSIDEIKRGYKEYSTYEGKTERLTLEQACQNPQVLKADYIGVTEDTVVEVTKVSTVEAKDQEGNLLIDNSTDRATAFQEVYFSDPTEFGLIEETSNPEKFTGYLRAMKEEMVKYRQPDHLNMIKALKRSYNYFKSQGDLASAQELAEVFSSDAAAIYQLVDRLSLSQVAEGKGINVQAQTGIILERLKQLLTQNPTQGGQEILKILTDRQAKPDLDQIRNLALAISNNQVNGFLVTHSNIRQAIESIINS